MTETQLAFLAGTIVFGVSFSAVECARDLGYITHEADSWKLLMATIVFGISFVVSSSLNL